MYRIVIAHLPQSYASLSLKHTRTTSSDPIFSEHFSRVLKVALGNEFDPIRCSFELADVRDQSVQYEAISYDRGDTNDRTEIVCNGSPYYITLSLFRALQRLREESCNDTRILWADAICINQKDV